MMIFLHDYSEPENESKMMGEKSRPANSTQSSWPFDKLFYFVMNTAVGGEFGGVEGVDDTIFPTQLEIDYVRMYHGKK